MTGTETAGCLIAMKVTGEPEPAAIKEDLHCRPCRAHRTNADSGHGFLQRFFAE
ncbi:hypothetical protein [Burkholderia ubonensis]|uniref:hypothetical protein n=1 Tax=Burkholderia ubonensis TaxID=101571 RepID=UPI001C4364B7|nr:hypothetical protein [Burkholderia ubonensis]